MSGFSDRVGIQIFINGREFPLDRVNSFETLHISCSARLFIPMMNLRIRDAARWLSKTQDLVDGVPIIITYENQGVRRTHRFRLHNFTDVQDSTGISYSIDGYLDNPLWWLASDVQIIKGTSNEVIARIAEKCKLDYRGTKTTDSQLWAQKNKKYHEFAKTVTRHGYVDNESCMVLAYDLDDKLFYTNVSVKKEAVAKFFTARFDQNAYTVTDVQNKNRSGIMNNISGYAEGVRNQSLFNLNQSSLKDKVDAVKLSQKLMLHSDLYNLVNQSRVFFRPIDAGNVHSNYDAAAYQNKRIANLYAFNVEVTIAEPTKDVRLLDFVDFEAKTQDGQVAAMSGRYIVTSRVIYIQGINYNEKFELTRQGLNTTAESQI
jgi:hypothetical protein